MITQTRFAAIVAGGVAAMTTVALSISYADDTSDPSDGARTSAFMRAKLASSQRALEGLVTDDFGLIERAAQEMKQMSRAAQWPTAKDKSYEHYQEAFRRQCDQLAKLAETKNHAGAHYSYLQLTTTCINCHDYVRQTFRVTRDKTNPQGPVILIPNAWEGSSRQDSTREARYEK